MVEHRLGRAGVAPGEAPVAASKNPSGLGTDLKGTLAHPGRKGSGGLPQCLGRARVLVITKCLGDAHRHPCVVGVLPECVGTEPATDHLGRPDP